MIVDDIREPERWPDARIKGIASYGSERSHGLAAAKKNPDGPSDIMMPGWMGSKSAACWLENLERCSGDFYQRLSTRPISQAFSRGVVMTSLSGVGVYMIETHRATPCPVRIGTSQPLTQDLVEKSGLKPKWQQTRFGETNSAGTMTGKHIVAFNLSKSVKN